MLFLVSGNVSFTPYMRDQRKPTHEIRLVEAVDEDEAVKKFCNHFESQSIPNDDSYWVDSVEASAVIV